MSSLFQFPRKFTTIPRDNKYDIIIIGGGIIGTAIAKTLKPKFKRIALLEKEKEIAQHQSSHNSNVIHAGIYYPPNSLKAKMCVQGSKMIYEYCENKNIPTIRSGKLIIASNILETYRLKVLYQRGIENQIPGLEILKNLKEINEIQPNCKGLQALWSPNTGNINWEIVTRNFGKDFQREGGHIFLQSEVENVTESTFPSHPVQIEVKEDKVFFAKYAILCLGLYSGTLLDHDDKIKELKNISLKVDYQILTPKMRKFIKTNIYAMPHIDMPFIGVHISPMVDGSVLLGPTAIPALKLDGYQYDQIDLKYIQSNVFSKEFALLFLKNIKTCFNQMSEIVCKDSITDNLGFFPMISKNDTLPGPSGVQGQMVNHDGEFVEDFIIDIFEGEGIRKRLINCRFIPSPGATCSLAIADFLSKCVEKVCV